MNSNKHGPDSQRRRLLKAPLLAGAGVALSWLPGQELPSAVGREIPPLGEGGRSFALVRQHGLVSGLRFAGDGFDTDYVAPGRVLGHVQVRYRQSGSDWQSLDTAQSASDRRSSAEGFEIEASSGQPLHLESRLQLRDGALYWDWSLRNTSDAPLEIGDLALPLPLHTQFEGGKPATAAVLKHSFIGGHGSFAFWMRSNSIGPYLLMTLQSGSHLEYWDRQPTEGAPPTWRVYVHAAVAGAETAAQGCQWRQPLTSRTLAPAGQTGDRFLGGLRFDWVEDYAGVRAGLVEAGAIDVQVVPGMTVPRGRETLLALHSQQSIERLVPEYAQHTVVQDLGERAGRRLFKLDFSRLGENRLAIHYGQEAITYLEFFVTEPVETLLRKRAAFIAAHQVRDESKWYNGLLAEWASDRQVMLSPDNYDRIGGWRIYEVSCDDPGLSKPAFLASKNAEYPEQTEVSALDDYIEHFVWGGLQQTTSEPYPYGIYGIPDWQSNRIGADPGPKARKHLWRPYDYPHVALMYYGMYRIARDYPQIRTRLTAADYLERAWGTALAMFTVPAAIVDWQAYSTGFYNELFYPELIDELARTGHGDRATQLREHWERKVRNFIEGGTDLFASEYAFDSTGFESTQALARYAIDHAAQGRVVADATATRRFSDQQMRANLFCRGVIEPAYYTLGSDYRAEGGDAFTLSYMAQMGGWAVLDYALHDANDPHPYLRLASASQLSAFALLNTGDAGSGYGYWYPGKGNDGTSAGGFEPAPSGMTWLDQPHHRGPWYYSCESDLGFCAALRAAATILADDPVFGRICYGGRFRSSGYGIEMIPEDGVRRRLHLRLTGGIALGLELARDRFAAGQPVEVRSDARAFRFRLESDNYQPHTLRLRVYGLPAGAYVLEAGGRSQLLQAISAGIDLELQLDSDALRSGYHLRPA